MIGVDVTPVCSKNSTAFYREEGLTVLTQPSFGNTEGVGVDHMERKALEPQAASGLAVNSHS